MFNRKPFNAKIPATIISTFVLVCLIGVKSSSLAKDRRTAPPPAPKNLSTQQANPKPKPQEPCNRDSTSSSCIVFNLQDSLNLAMQNSTTIKINKVNTKRAIVAEKVAVLNAFTPSLQYSIQANKVVSNNVSLSGDAPEILNSFFNNLPTRSSSHLLDINYDLSFYKKSLIQKIAKEGRKTATSNHLTAVNTLAQQVVSVYFNLIISREKIEMLKQSVKLQNKVLLEAKGKKQSGAASEADLIMAEVGLEQQKALLDLELLNLETTKETYKDIVGQPSSDKIAVPKKFLKMPMNTLDEIMDKAKANSPEIKSALHTSNAAKYTKYYQYMQTFPSVSIGFSSQNALTGYPIYDHELVSNTIYLKFSLTLNAALFGSNSAAVYDHQTSLLQLEATKETIKNKARTEWGQYLYKKREIQLNDKIYLAKLKIVSYSKNRASIGKASKTDVLKAQVDTLKAKIELLESQKGFYINSISLLGSLGLDVTEVS